VATQIGSLNVKVSASVAGLVQGLDQSAAKIRQFSATARTGAAAMATGVSAALNNITGINLGAQSAQLQSLIGGLSGVAGALALGGPVAAVGAIAAATGAVIAFASASMNAVDIQVRLGRQLGITAQEAAGMEILANNQNVASQEVAAGFRAWTDRLVQLRRELRSGTGDAPISRALRELGIDAQSFANMPVGEQFAQIAEGAQRIETFNERNTALTAAMGSGASRMIPIFEAQAGQLRNLGGLAAEYGYSISQADADGISNIVQGLQETGRFVGSLLNTAGQQAAMLLAPVAAEAGAALRELVQQARPLVNLLAGAFAAATIGGVAAVVGILVDVVRASMPVLGALSVAIVRVRDAFDEIRQALSPAISQLSAAFGASESGIDVMSGLVAGINVLTPRFIAFLRVLGAGTAAAIAVAAEAFRRFGTAVTAVGALLSVATGGQFGQGIAEAGAQFAADMEAARASALAASAAILSSTGPTGSGTTEGAANTAAWLIASVVQASQRGAATHLRDLNQLMTFLENRNPFATWRQSLVDARDALSAVAAGVPLSTTAISRSLGEATMNLLQQQSPATRAASVALAGSVQEQAAIANATRQDRDASRDPIQRLLAAQEQARQQRQRQIEIGERVEQAIRDGRIAPFGD
jgi:hypothetical protein